MAKVKDSNATIIEAFHECGDKLRRFVFRFARRPEDVDDCVQEALARTLDAASKSDIEFPKSYLFTTAKNIAMRENAKLSSKLTEYIEDYEGPALTSNESSALDIIADREELYCLARAIEELPLQCRRVIKLRLIEQMSQKEIAERLGISVSTTEKHIAKGLRRCEAYLQLQGFDRRLEKKHKNKT